MPPKAFKTPRPATSAIKKTKKVATNTARKSTGSTTSISQSRSTSKSKSNPRDRGSNGFKVPARISGFPSLSPDTEPDIDEDPFASDIEAVDDPIDVDSEDEPEDEEVTREAIPPDLLTRLLHENFKEEGTRLSKDASAAVGKYMETFVREALARAAFARVEIDERNGMGSGDGFLEVEDLEKLAPQLLLDF